VGREFQEHQKRLIHSQSCKGSSAFRYEGTIPEFCETGFKPHYSDATVVTGSSKTIQKRANR